MDSDVLYPIGLAEGVAQKESQVLVGRARKQGPRLNFFIYYEQQIKQELKRILISGCRCNERLKAKTDGTNRLTYTGL